MKVPDMSIPNFFTRPSRPAGLRPAASVPTPSERPAYGTLPQSRESDEDLLEIPPATVCRFILTLPNGLWPADRAGQENTVDMVASLSDQPSCDHFRYLRLQSYDRFCPTLVNWPEIYYTVWLATSDQARRGVHQVGEVLFENGATDLSLEPEEISDGDSKPWVDDWKQSHSWLTAAHVYGLWTRKGD